jgi:hypothetical protein
VRYRARLQVAVDGPGNPEVQDSGLPGFRHQNIHRLEVAVNHALLVGVRDGVANPRNQLQTLARVERVTLRVFSDRHAVNEFHREERAGAVTDVKGTCFVDLRDARVLKPPEHLRFVLETAQH